MTWRSLSLKFLFLLCVALILVACGSRNVVSPDGATDGPALVDGFSWADVFPDIPGFGDLHLVDAPPPPLDAPVPAVDAPCTCKPGEVWLRGPCVPTFQLQTCAPTCDPKQPNACGAPSNKCDQWAAAPACMASAAVPACVPGQAMAFPPGTLRIWPKTGVAGKEVTITIEGGEPYIGALMWWLQVGGKPGPQLNPSGGCSTKFTYTFSKPGIYPVEIGYGGSTAVKGWSLAGFFTASGGSVPIKHPQPGDRCSAAGNSCSQATPYSCSCLSSRCVCTK